ncbi:hypothetical protein [Chryseobacterium profundimaris]|uniref:GyrI-like small molecule binding domain-containing protein n=1 Tax=Chryseobacterium profundimaris TaxID=1387275 RepID=A0ABY1NJ81_9FLAO|nr:hypothetical protein [Chryseobacterium profundimaris]SMP10792.1 hypothetical protein SAMN06264346_102238 [Chryseobacterium profundimaris]
MERKYHLSFEQKEISGNFRGGVPNIETITKLITQLKGYNIEYPCTNTIIFRYKDDKFDMSTFKNDIEAYFYITLSLIGNYNNEDIHIIHPNVKIDHNLSKKAQERIALGKMIK